MDKIKCDIVAQAVRLLSQAVQDAWMHKESACTSKMMRAIGLLEGAGIIHIEGEK